MVKIRFKLPVNIYRFIAVNTLNVQKYLRCSHFSPVPDYIKASVDAVIGIHIEEDPGDILVFLTGQVGFRGIICGEFGYKSQPDFFVLLSG